MSRRWLLPLLCLSVLFLSFVQLTSAGGELRVNETNSKVLFEKAPAEVVLAIENSTGKTQNARVEVELLDPSGQSISRTTQVHSISAGKKSLNLPLGLSFSDLKGYDRTRLLWYRLHYRLINTDSNNALTEGLVSLSEISSDLFEIRLTAPSLALEDGRYRARVDAYHPLNQQPAANVRVEAELNIETDSRKLKLPASRITDSKGRAFLDFVLPRGFPESRDHTPDILGEIDVTAQRGSVVSKASGRLSIEWSANIVISTDKPLYQPGQVMHVRALVFNTAKYAVANQSCVLKITDPQDQRVYTTVLRSSRFGVINADWSIPESIRLGTYEISVGLEGDNGSENSYQSVRIGRYDLPNFSVSVEADRKFYLPGQNAEIRVRADYLFGQPVAQGEVRVVRETQREWNYKEQKWEIDEGEKYEGKTDAKGVFTAQVDLAEQFQDLEHEEYTRFRDLTYSAYFTDPTTNRTEHRRFDIRLTKEAIHVYIVEQNERYNPGLPIGFYVSTAYADGSPASCQVRTKFVQYDESGSAISRASLQLQTNRYGLAKASGVRWPREFNHENIELLVSAVDSKGRDGSTKETLRVTNDPAVRVETDKTLYHTGDPINAVVTSSVGDQILNVDLVSNSTVIHSERVKLRGGRANIAFPYKRDMKDELMVAAYPLFAKVPYAAGARLVLFPQEPELKVSLRPSQGSYRPGEDATLDFKVRAAQGSSAESVLGLVVFDKAVAERFRTDQDFDSSNFRDSVQKLLGFDEQLAGVTLQDLKNSTLSMVAPPGYDLLAEVLLNRDASYYPSFYGGNEYRRDHDKIFQAQIQAQLAPVTKALVDRYLQQNEYPKNEDNLRRVLQTSQIELDNLRDPWGTPYRAVFWTQRESDVLDLMTAGADKRFNTEDDFSARRLDWSYFPPIGREIDSAVKRYHERSGSYIRDFPTLRAELAKSDFNLDQLRDRWGQAYRFEFPVEERKYVIAVRSGGPDKKFSSSANPLDDFLIWSSSIDYFAEQQTKIESFLTERFERMKQFPANDQALREALTDFPQTIENLRDPWGRRYYPVFTTRVLTDRSRLENRTTFGDPASTRTVVVPFHAMAAYVSLGCMGPDGVTGNGDDFTVAAFTSIQREGQTPRLEPQRDAENPSWSETHGAIQGVVMDPQRARVAGTAVTLKREIDGHRYFSFTNDEGKYGFGNLLPGLYEVRFEGAGFKTSVITGVWVRATTLIEVNSELEPGEVTESVIISAAIENLNLQTSASLGSTRRRGRINLITKSGTQDTSTPRLREYFPETLVWQPSLETDREGRAQFNFKLADNITTWKVAAIASTEDGRIATTEKEIKAFQPFFVEHEPPRVLTEGDEISLPIVVRNYLEQAQNVKLEVKPESWFALLGPARKQSTVAAGNAKRETFDFRAISSVKDGKQRITAVGSGGNDAIEKPITVHPDGEEMSVTAGDIFGGAASLELELPENAIPNSSRAELKIYPNLMAHMIESVERIMSRPYGCGEQTISSTYPSLLLVRHYKQTGEDFPLRVRAERYLESGYRRLLNYRTESGGFSYWGDGDTDFALTAYALRFLVEAADLIEVDRDVITQAGAWLVKQQQKNGSWKWNRFARDGEDIRGEVMITAYITRILLMTQSKLSMPASAEVATAQKLAFAYLSQNANEIDDPYTLAAFALTAVKLKESKAGKTAIDKLRSLAIADDGATHWSSHTSTPFFGWGTAGQVETTALVLQALIQYCNSSAESCESESKLITTSLLYVLRRKDRYGVWHSTQATINVLDAMNAMFSRASSTNEATAEILVNGRVVNTIKIPVANRLVDPITIDMTQFIHTGRNKIELRRADGLAFASAQAVVNYYIPWATANHAEARGLRLIAKFDKTETAIGDAITCDVEAGRLDSAGYGMLLAEIGLPPGADVDRSSLEAAMRGSESAISQYDVLPDRVVLYIRPQTSRAKFSFKFRPRFGLNAKSAPSVIYDYYNPESRATVAPQRFRVR